MSAVDQNHVYCNVTNIRASDSSHQQQWTCKLLVKYR